MKYSEKLKRPEWQEKRLSILNRDGFTCILCNTYGATVSAHHNYYLPNREPWDYPDDALYTLCDKCHSEEHAIEASTKDDLFEAFKRAGFTNHSLIHIILGLRFIDRLPASPSLVAHAVGCMFSNNGAMCNMYKKFSE